MSTHLIPDMLQEARTTCWQLYMTPLADLSVRSLSMKSRSKVFHTDELGSALADLLKEAPEATAQAIVDQLASSDRTRLLSALLKAEPGAFSPEYVAQLFRAADTQAPCGLLDKTELQKVLQADRLAVAAAQQQKVQAASSTGPPSTATLATISVAAGLPFIGFGFLDNFIMILAGDKIEASVGVALGLSTMAAAGLGNLVSDIAGLGLADQIEARVKTLQWARPAPMSWQQKSMLQTRVARTAGCTVGVTIGCLMGMLPLLWMKRPAQGQQEIATPVALPAQNK